MINLLRLVVKIIKSPINTIKGTEIISYDKDAMLRLFSIVSAVNFVSSFALFYENLTLVGIVVIAILAPFIMFLICNIAIVLYYATFKLLGKGFEANYDGVKTALYPLFLTSMIFNIVISLIAHVTSFKSSALQFAISLWFYVMTFFFLRYKLRQTIVRSIIISLLPLFFAIIIELV